MFGFVRNQVPISIDILGMRTLGFGGWLCVAKNCNSACLSNWSYIPEDPPAGLHSLPAPGTCVEADAVYYPGGAGKISDTELITIHCDSDGRPAGIPHTSGGTWPVPPPDFVGPDRPPPRWPDNNIPPYLDHPGVPLLPPGSTVPPELTPPGMPRRPIDRLP